MRVGADIYIVAFCLTASQLARGRENTQTFFYLPHILTRHRSTAELQVVGMETSRSKSHVEEPTPESHDIAMFRLRIRERHTISCVGLGPSLNVLTRNSISIHNKLLYQLSFSPERSDPFGSFAIQAFQCPRGQHGDAPGPRQRCISFCQCVTFKSTSYPYELYFAF